MAVIAPMAGKHEKTFALIHRVLVDAVRKPDLFWMLCETEEDVRVAEKAVAELHALDLLPAYPANLGIDHCPTPQENGRYEVIPYSHKINAALDRSEADYYVYLDNGSMPAPEKYDRMARHLDEHPNHGSVYCSQKRTGFRTEEFLTGPRVDDPFCVLNFTQVMHRKTKARWPLDMALANPDVADAVFFRSMARELGPVYPLESVLVMDVHHMPSPAAEHLTP